MDSSPMAPANNSSSSSRGESSSEEEASISVTQTQAKEACVLFQLGKYADCLKVLNQLLQKKPDDPKILHNMAVAENIQDGFSNPKRFLEALNNLKQQSERLAHPSGENAELVNNENKSVGNNGTNSVLNQVPSVNGPQGILVDDFDVSVIMFNIAVTLYHLHEYDKCFSILERLFQNIEPIDERVARHICLLLLDVALVCHRVSRAADVINYLERMGGNNLGSHGDTVSITQQQQSTSLLTKSTSAPSNVIASDSINSDSIANANGPESPLPRSPSEETLLESFASTLDSGSQNLTRASNDLPRAQDDDSLFITPDLRLKVHLYKVWVLLLTRNLKAAKREVKMAMNVARGKDYSLALFLKSQLEYARGNHRKAIKLLMASTNQETGTSSLYYNNLGCIYYQLGKYQTSTVFFSKALSTSSALRKERPLKLLSFSQDKSGLFIYNCGLVYLASGKPVLAVRCFQKAGSVFYKRPLLWLRMAECCIMALEKKSEINVNVIGRGKWRQLVVDLNSRNLLQVEPDLSLTFARSCLLNALYLLNPSDELECGLPPNLVRDENSNFKGSNLTVGPAPGSGLTGQVNSNGEVKDSKVGNSSVNTSLQSSINEYEGLCGKENQKILQAVFANLAFVYLELGNAESALDAAKCLLRLPECSRAYIFLGNLYAAEAYCLQNRPKQASEHLSSYISGQNSVELPYSQEDCDIWQPKKVMDLEESNVNNTPYADELLSQGSCFFLKPEEARGTLLANLAATAVVEGDIERAHQFATQALLVIPNNPEAILTATYIDLVCGKAQEAISKLKQCSCVRFVRGTLEQSRSS